MTMQTINGGLHLPGGQMIFPSTPNFPNVFTLNDSNDACALIFQIPKAGNIHSIGFRTGTVTVGDTMKVGLYTVDTTTGVPTASAYKGMVDGTQVIANADDLTFFIVNLSTDATAVVAGDDVAVVIQFNSFVAGNLQIESSLGTGGAAAQGYGYGAFFETSWVHTDTGPLILYIKYSDGSVAYIPAAYPISAVNTVTYNSTSANEKNALKFQIPFPSRLSGVSLIIGVSGDFDIVLYDSDGTSVLGTISRDKDIIDDTTARRASFRFPTPISLSKNTNYYLSVNPTTASNVSIITFTVPEAVALNQMAGGTNFILSTKDGANPWADVSTQVPLITLLLDQFDDAIAVGGGLLTHPGMAGGMRA